jgi:hypothetical protein
MDITDPNKDPFFSVEDARLWMTSSGYQLHALHDESVISASFWAPEDALSKAFQNLVNHLNALRISRNSKNV